VKNGNKGSIPMVLIIVVCLGIFAVSSLFLSQGTARMDKRTELNQMAWTIAQSAVEETLVKLTNGKATWQDGDKVSYLPHATQLAYPDTKVVNIGPVEIMGRVIEAPNDGPELVKFYEDMTACPNWYADPTNGGKPDLNWRGKVGVSTPNGANGNVLLPKSDPNAIFSVWANQPPAASPNVSLSAGANYAQVAQSDAGNNTADGGAIKAAFAKLLPLTKVTAPADDLSTPVPGVNCHSDAELGILADGSADTANPTGFAAVWDDAMNGILTQVNSRIANCAGNKNYGVGAELGALTAGKALGADGTAEERLRNEAQNGGALAYKASLVTLQSKVTVNVAGVQVTQPYSCERMVQNTNLKSAMDFVRFQMAAYLAYNLNLTANDMIRMGWLTKAPGATTGGAKVINTQEKMMTKLADGFPANPGPVVWPFQVATCLNQIHQ